MRRLPLMHSMLLTMGVLPPLPSPIPRVVGTAERGGDLFVDGELVRIEEGDTAEVIQGRLDEAIRLSPMAIALRPRPSISPFFRCDAEPGPAPRKVRADPARKAKRKAQAKARRKGRR